MAASIKSERVFIKIHLQVLVAYVPIDTTNTVFREAPKSFESVGVCVSVNVHLRGMVDALVSITHLRQTFVGSSFVCKYSGCGQDVGLNQWKDSRFGRVGYYLCDDSAFPLYRSPDSGFTNRAATGPELFIRVLVAFFPAVETFVALYLAGQRLAISFEHLSDQMEHAPSGLVRNTNFATQLFCRDSATSRGHDVDGVKPEFQRGRGVLEDSPFHRVLMASAILTSIRRALSIAMVLRNLLALRTEDAVWIMALSKIIETGGVIRELPLKLHERIGAIRRSASGWLVAICFAHESTVAQGSTAVKGIHTFC